MTTTVRQQHHAKEAPPTTSTAYFSASSSGQRSSSNTCVVAQTLTPPPHTLPSISLSCPGTQPTFSLNGAKIHSVLTANILSSNNISIFTSKSLLKQRIATAILGANGPLILGSAPTGSEGRERRQVLPFWCAQVKGA